VRWGKINEKRKDPETEIRRNSKKYKQRVCFETAKFLSSNEITSKPKSISNEKAKGLEFK